MSPDTFRRIALSLPETSESAHIAHPDFRVRDKIFAMRHDLHEGRWSIWCKAPPGAQQALVGSDGDRFFVPPYVGHHGWIGIDLAVEQDWELVASLIEDSYRMTAPKRLLAQLDPEVAAG